MCYHQFTKLSNLEARLLAGIAHGNDFTNSCTVHASCITQEMAQLQCDCLDCDRLRVFSEVRAAARRNK